MTIPVKFEELPLGTNFQQKYRYGFKDETIQVRDSYGEDRYPVQSSRKKASKRSEAYGHIKQEKDSFAEWRMVRAEMGKPF